MKICYLANADSIHTQRWVKYFADKGHEVHLISPRPFGDCNIENVKLHLLKRLHPQIRFISFIANLPLEIIQVRKLIKKIKPDIIHAHYIADYGFHAALTNFHPFILSAWGSDVLVTPKKSFIVKMMVEYALKKADTVTTTAKFMGKYLTKEFGLPENRIVRIPWGIDLKIFHRGYEEEVKKLREKLEIKDNSPVIISNRAIHPKYEIQTIVEAIPHITKKHPNATLIFIRGNGDKNFEKIIKKRISELGIDSNIRFIPRFISPKEMAVYLDTSDILISIPKTDQFASSVMEGMACGAIPIVSDIEAYKQYLKDEENAFFINPDDPKELTEKTIFCIEHPELKETFYKINKKFIEEDEDWSKNAVKMEELYKNLLGR